MILSLVLKEAVISSTYHKFVKTTPKPSATKKSSGELVGPPPPPPPLGADEVAAGGASGSVEEGTTPVTVGVAEVLMMGWGTCVPLDETLADGKIDAAGRDA